MQGRWTVPSYSAGMFLMMLACSAELPAPGPSFAPDTDVSEPDPEPTPEADPEDDDDPVLPDEDDGVDVPTPDVLSDVVAIAAGTNHTCAIDAVGDVFCWGANFGGQLGDGTTIDALRPVQVTGLSAPAVEISAGVAHTCVVLDDASLACWGHNGSGQLGDDDVFSSPRPLVVRDDVTTVACGGTFTCAVVAGQTECFGQGDVGQLDADHAADVLGAGYFHACSVDAGVVSCWGDETSGAAGTVDIDDALHVVASEAATCAVRDGGDLSCWGHVGHPVLELGPEPVVVDTNVDDVALGQSHRCMLGGDDVRCLGDNDFGQLGTGNTVASDLPVPVALPPVVAIAAGPQHTCAVDDAGTVWCWGFNPMGQLGNGTGQSAFVPTQVLD